MIFKLTCTINFFQLSFFNRWLDNLITVRRRVKIMIISKTLLDLFIVRRNKILWFKSQVSTLNLCVWTLIGPSVKLHLILFVFALNPWIPLYLILLAQLRIFCHSDHTVFLNVHDFIQHTNFLVQLSYFWGWMFHSWGVLFWQKRVLICWYWTMLCLLVNVKLLLVLVPGHHACFVFARN